MLFQNGRIRDTGHVFDIIYSQVAQITYGKSSHETYYTHSHPSLRYMLWWKDKTSSAGGNELRWEMLGTACGSISTCKLPKQRVKSQPKVSP